MNLELLGAQHGTKILDSWGTVWEPSQEFNQNFSLHLLTAVSRSQSLQKLGLVGT